MIEEPVEMNPTPFAIPDRIAIDADGYGWRVWDDDEMWSMVPQNPDNSPIPQPVTWFVPASPEGVVTPEPPPFGSVPFGTMFVPGPVFLHGDNEWLEAPGPLTVPPRLPEGVVTLDRIERGVIESLRPRADDDLPSPPSWDQVDWLIAIIDRLVPYQPEDTKHG